MQGASLAALFALTSLVACQGNVIGERPLGNSESPAAGTGGGAATLAPLRTITCDEAPHAGASELRRLSAAQYRNVIRDIFDGRLAESASYPGDVADIGKTESGFSTEASLYRVSESGVHDLMSAAEDVAEALPAALPDLLPCSASATAGDEVCAHAFIDQYVRRAYRHAPSTDESEALLVTFRAATDAGATFAEALALLLAQVLQMPQFLYAIEQASPSTRQLTGVEMASRLAFMFWDSVPDDELLAAAERGALDTAQGVAEQAGRLFESPLADRAIVRFMREWTETKEVSPADKSAEAFPFFDQPYADSMNATFDRFAIDMTRGGANFGALLTAPASGGILSQPAWLASLAHSTESSFVFRGRTISRRFMCMPLGAPPAGAQAELAKIALPEAPTGKEVAAGIEADASCAGCHALLDPAGLAFERFDALGRYRETYDSGRPIDPAGTYAAPDGDIVFANQTELVARLAESEAAHECFARQIFRFAMSRLEQEADACTLQEVLTSLETAPGSIEDALVTMASSDTIRYRRDQ